MGIYQSASPVLCMKEVLGYTLHYLQNTTGSFHSTSTPFPMSLMLSKDLTSSIVCEIRKKGCRNFSFCLPLWSMDGSRKSYNFLKFSTCLKSSARVDSGSYVWCWIKYENIEVIVVCVCQVAVSLKQQFGCFLSF